MNKITKYVISMLMAFFLCTSMEAVAYASDGQEYITISVEAEDNHGNLLYALDTDDPSAFSSSNEFSVPAGTNHTIYVKDAAGNITSQEYIPAVTDYDKAYLYDEDEDEGRTVNIDITLDDVPKTSEYEYAGDLLKDPAEEGQGTLYEKVETPVNDPDATRLFYTVTTDEGEVFYLVVDQNQNSNNVYLLDQVNLSDLHALAVNDSGSTDSDASSSLLSDLSNAGNEKTNDGSMVNDTLPKKNNSMKGNIILVLIIVVIGGGVYYYKNIYKSKKDEQMDLIDAPDKDDFAVEEDDDEVDFGLDDDYQEQIMSQLLEEDDIDIPDDENYGVDENIEQDNTSNFEQDGIVSGDNTDSYATSHIYEEEADADEYDDDLDAPDEEEDEE